MNGNAEIVAVVAMDEKRGIGKDNGFPWPRRIPEDSQRFIDKTTGHPVIMGRLTYDSIPERFRPLVDRQNIVVTRNPELELPGCVIAHTLDEAIQIAQGMDSQRISVIGGAEIYRASLPLVDKLYLTTIFGDFEADKFFPEFRDQFPNQLRTQSSSYKGINYTFEDLTRKV